MPNVKALGTLQKNNYLEIRPGQIAEFNILVWNTEPMEIEFEEKNIPKDWITIIEPKKFVLTDNVTSSETIVVQNRYVNSLPVKIFLIPPKDVKSGIYEIMIKMVAGKNETGISFFQEKNFNFKVNISGSYVEQKETTKELIKDYVSKTRNFTFPSIEIEKTSTDYTKIIFWSIAIAITLAICWILYKL